GARCSRRCVAEALASLGVWASARSKAAEDRQLFFLLEIPAACAANASAKESAVQPVALCEVAIALLPHLAGLSQAGPLAAAILQLYCPENYEREAGSSILCCSQSAMEPEPKERA